MDFFGAQRTRSRRSLMLYGLFLLVAMAHMVVALGIMALLLTLFTGGIYHWVLILVMLWTGFSFAAGSFLEYRRLRAGGRAIAQRVGAVRLFIDHSEDALTHSQGVAHRHEEEPLVRYTSQHIAVRDERDFPVVYRRYHEFAQQLAIASGMSMPILYVMPEEQGINGFVAGHNNQDMVLVVTQGALDKLSDEALYGLIGHEYGHILHGDASFNLQLMVVLAGLQLLYDWSDPIESMTATHDRRSDSFELMANHRLTAAQKSIDTRARSTEAETSQFTTHNDWVSYWQAQAQQSQHAATSGSRWLSPTTDISSRAPRSIWTLILHGFSFSSMASAQLIKHSFNRERELLADATSVQLTRSPAILATLKAIHQDAIGSRLTGIADINGLSHFFFASSGADLGDISWFATHPSLAERMRAINANDYDAFARQVVNQQQLNQQKLKDIYEQRRLGDWGDITHNSLSSSNKKLPIDIKKTNKHDLREMTTKDPKVISTAQESVTETAFIETDNGLEFKVDQDIIIDGRLQIDVQAISTVKQLKPWQAGNDVDLPTAMLISDKDINRVSLAHYVLNYSHHALGALAVIETVLLCHQNRTLSTAASYTLADIWCGHSETHLESASAESRVSEELQILPHNLDSRLLEEVAHIDRRLDSGLIAFALNNLKQHDLAASTIEDLKQYAENNHSHKSHNHYRQQRNARAMMQRYYEGLQQLCQHQLNNDLLGEVEYDEKVVDNHARRTLTDDKKQSSSSILSLWQALHLQQLIPVMAHVLGEDDFQNASSRFQQSLRAGMQGIISQLDPSGQTFHTVTDVEKAILILFVYRLTKDASSDGKIANKLTTYVKDLRRYARLIGIALDAVSDINLHWLMLTTQSLNSIQLLAISDVISTTIKTLDLKNSLVQQQQSASKVAYNGSMHHDYRLWLSTLHTVMLHDTIVSQDEYDCLTLLAERWLGVRQLIN